MSFEKGQPSDRRPNFIFFLVDDMVWMDSSTYGSEYYETPNLDRLAKQGMLFTDAYAAAPVKAGTSFLRFGK